MNAADVIAQLVALEKAVGRRDPTTLQSMLLTVEEGVLELERLTIETMRENALLRRRLENWEQQSVAARPQTPGMSMAESRTHAG
jgi:hypothetical protein